MAEVAGEESREYYLVPMGQGPFKTKQKKRVPFPKRSLPQAGESLREAFLERVDEVGLWLMPAGVFFAVAVVELGLRAAGRSWSPWGWMVFAVALGGVAAWKWFRLESQIPSLQQGIRGEREVGRMLEKCRGLGYEVFHDLHADGFNVDHVLIGPGGVFAIETKAWSKPQGRRATVDFDGERIKVDGFEPDRDPVKQAEACGRYVADLLEATTARKVSVRPVIIFAGWWVNRPPSSHVLVLNEKQLLPILEREVRRLSPDDVALFAERLADHLSRTPD